MRFETEDFALAATLHTIGAKYVDHKRGPDNKVVFCFEKNEDLERAVPAYYRDELCVSPQKYFYSQRFLKSIIRSN